MSPAMQIEDEAERRQHLDAIQSLTKDLGSPAEEVRQVYESVLEEFQKVANVRIFLTIIVSKAVKDLLREMKPDERNSKKSEPVMTWSPDLMEQGRVYTKRATNDKTDDAAEKIYWSLLIALVLSK